MSKAARTLLIFGWYTVINGLGLLLAPNTFLGLFGFPSTQEVWVRVAGMLISLLGYYYIASARSELASFLQFSVYGRVAVFAFYVIFVSLGLLPSIALLIGSIDLLGAVWTQLKLRAN